MNQRIDETDPESRCDQDHKNPFSASGRRVRSQGLDDGPEQSKAQKHQGPGNQPGRKVDPLNLVARRISPIGQQRAKA